MLKKTKFKSRLLDFFIVSIFIFSAGYFAFTFWKDVNTSKNRTDKEKVAEIVFKNRIAQRKFDDRVVWERIDKKTPLYNGDLLRTSNLAEVSLSFNDGSSVSIYENTMIQIYYSDEEGVKLSVNGGSVNLDTSQNGKMSVTLEDGSTVFMEGGSSLSARSGNGMRSTVELNNGSASIMTREGNNEELTSGDSVSIQKNGTIRKNSVTVTSIPPFLRVLNFDEKKVPVKLEWSNPQKNEAEAVVVQTSYKKDFSEIIEEKTVEDSNDTLLNLSDGTVYWRVFPADKREEATEGKISVIPAELIRLLSPAPSSVFYYRDRNPQLTFNWESAAYISHYLLKISANPDMSSPVVEKTVFTNAVELDSLGSGKWWWQVLPYYEINSIGYAGESLISSFEIQKAEALSPPQLTVPLEESTVFYTDTMDVNFFWKSQVSNASYDLLVSDTEDFSNIIYKTNTKTKNAKVKLPAPESEKQEYYWKVVRNSLSLDDKEPESEVRSFNVSKYNSVGIKLLYPPEEFQAESTKLAATNFVWKVPDRMKDESSVIQVSSTPDFESIDIEKTVSSHSLENMLLPEGEWWWRVCTIDDSGLKSEPAEPRHIVVLKDLESPEILDIENSEELLVSAGEPLPLEWNPVSGADYYNVSVYNSKNQLVAENAQEDNNRILLDLPQDSYTCRIQAVAAQTETSAMRTGPVEVIDFSVRNASPVLAVRPAADTHIDGLDAVKKPVVFNWKEGGDKPVSSEFVLKKRQADGTLKVVESVPVKKNTISLSRLPAGEYEWQIVASTNKGVSLNSKANTFFVDSLPALKKAVLVSPENDFLMDTGYLKKNRSIVFEWKSVPNATEYSFVLYKKEADGRLRTVYTEKNIKGTKIRFKKYKLLDKGDFSWSVTAYAYAKDGFEERTSAVSSGEFRISFNEPSKIETIKPGKLYGD